MKLGNIFGNSSNAVDQSRSSKVNENARQEQIANQKVKGGEDSITISPLARQLATIQTVLSQDESSKAQRIEELKQAVASGSYKVSSEDLAQSFLNYYENN